MLTQRLIASETGVIEVFENRPEVVKAIALVTHPHPLMGGNPQHKIPQLIAEVLVERGYLVWRPSFRGMGQSTGQHDHGEGESDDIAYLARQLQSDYPHVPFVAGGFSFGAYTWTKTWHLLADHERPQKLLLAGLPCGTVRDLVEYQPSHVAGDLLLVHGTEDDICPMTALLEWAKPQKHPITIIPGANHFFTGYLKTFRHLVKRYYDQ